jgi:hypothetical protein
MTVEKILIKNIEHFIFSLAILASLPEEEKKGA